MHCIEIKSGSFVPFRNAVRRLGGEVSIVSRYTDRGVRLLDVEVSKDTKAVDSLERQFAFVG